MIKINNICVSIGNFPDGTQNISFENIDVLKYNIIKWNYEGDNEIFTLMCCVDYIRRVNKSSTISLYLPYIPNARMDRIKDVTENFSLKVFAKFINSLNFDNVFVKNVHSNVSLALIDNVEDVGIESDLEFLLLDLFRQNDVADKTIIFFPDEGACKRYSELPIFSIYNFSFAFGIKKRDWKTGEILDYNIVGDVNGKNVLIIDDICSAGGTFYNAGLKLKDLGAKKIDLYITHCENNISNGKLLSANSPINKIYTTKTIISNPDLINNSKIEIINE